ncbi:IclR family transcriptional regulator [Rhodobacteraceae bacterium 2376]|uniref:IclR family transcriptional regulator n=1 Tax=Rhabdonatronobacter sediminivivens TaxID=2743469 RepID=A0A7Z0KYG6_9RHOB|nr:HTH-type transcriptional regulator BhcR [Rhabdonatronobacter sediminivivens]NYS24471.1 IclR family transcriptional regulator [Rhabdonatronobacter sediminivivens]
MTESTPRAARRGRPRAFQDRSEQNTIRALDRAMALLHRLSQTDGLSLTDLAQEAGESPATVYRVLITLQAHGMVELDPATQLWHVGAGTFRAGTAFLRRTSVVERARGPMARLMRDTGETANLGIEQADEVLFLSQVETHSAIRAFFPPGTRSPMHVSGIGKALLAWMPATQLEAIVARKGLERFTSSSLVTPEALADDLSATRARGYALDDEERAEGMRCIAAPVFNAHAEPVAGLSVSAPSFRLARADAPQIGGLVQRAAAEVTRAIGGLWPEGEKTE